MAYRIVFCGTPEFAVPSLKALIADPEFEILRVFTQPDRPAGRGKKLKPSPVKVAALEAGLKVETPVKVSADEWIRDLVDLELDAGVVVAFGQILSQEFLDSFKQGCVNVHSSLLPRWRGAAPMQRALIAGDKESGVSLQKVVKKLDAGDVIAERKLDLPLSMGATELYQTLSELGSELLIQDFKKFLKGDIEPRKQDDALVTHAAKIMKEEGLIDWNQPAFDIHNKIRGLNMGGPYAYTNFNGKTLKIHESVPGTFSPSGKSEPGTGAKVPGTVLEVTKDSFSVVTGSGAIELLVVQPESKARMSAADFIRGYQIKEGVKLG